jgi:hypothetical protein
VIVISLRIPQSAGENFGCIQKYVEAPATSLEPLVTSLNAPTTSLRAPMTSLGAPATSLGAPQSGNAIFQGNLDFIFLSF